MITLRITNKGLEVMRFIPFMKNNETKTTEKGGKNGNIK